MAYYHLAVVPSPICRNNKETVIGCAIGTGLGVLIELFGGKEGMLYGGAAGAAIGCTVGYDFQKKRSIEQLAKQKILIFNSFQSVLQKHPMSSKDSFTDQFNRTNDVEGKIQKIR